jgi:Tfp pilus assembly protein PilF
VDFFAEGLKKTGSFLIRNFSRDGYYGATMKPFVKNLVAKASIASSGWIVLFCCVLLASRLSAQDASLTNVMAEAESHEKKGETELALKGYLDADKIAPNNSEINCRLAKMYCDSMIGKDKAGMKEMAAKALECALNGEKADPNSPKAHVCVAVCYAKNFPFIDSQTKVNYSRAIKQEAEKAIEVDPKFDLAYHMLGRWNFEVSNMNFFVKSLVRIAYGGLPTASKKMAIDNFKKAVELMPNRIVNHLQLARMYHVTDQENLVSDELKKCVDLTPVDMDDKNSQDIAKKLLAGAKWPDDI